MTKAEYTFTKLADLTHEWRDELNRDEHGASDIQKLLDREKEILSEYSKKNDSHTLQKVLAGVYTVPTLAGIGLLGGGLLGTATKSGIPKAYRNPAVKGLAGLGALAGAGMGTVAAQAAGDYMGNLQDTYNTKSIAQSINELEEIKARK